MPAPRHSHPHLRPVERGPAPPPRTLTWVFLAFVALAGFIVGAAFSRVTP